MTKGFKQRLAAAALSAVMAFTAGAGANGMSAHAAAKKPYVSLRTAYKTLKVNETNKMTLKNNRVGWKITKVATEDRTVAMVYKKTASGFMVKGKAVGRTTVKARLRTTERKKYNSKLVKCQINVVPAEQETPSVPDVPQVPDVETKKNVATQEELDAALADSRLTEITIDTKEKTSLVIPQGTHLTTSLIVKAPQADIENNAAFKSIEIQQIAGDTWHENASGNTLRISAASARIIVGPGGRIRDITFTSAQATAKLVVNGAVENVTVSAKMSLDISSDLDQKPTVPVTIDAAAQGADVTAQVPLDVTVKAADAVLNFQKGSEGSKVKAEVKATIKNNTSGRISVTDAKNNTRQIQAGGSSIVNEMVTTYTPPISSGSGSSGSTGTSSTPSVTYYTVSFNGKEVRVRAGDKVRESDIPVVSKRNGDGYKFSGWYYADGKDEKGNIKFTKFDLSAAIDRNIELYPRWAMTEEDRVLDIKGSIFVKSGSAITVDLSRSNATVAIGDGDKEAAFVKLNDQTVTGSEGLIEANAKDGKLEIIIQTVEDIKVNSRKYRTEVAMPEGAENGIQINLAECVWSSYTGAEKQVHNQEELNEALADRSCSRITIISGGAFELRLENADRSDLKVDVVSENTKIDNYVNLGNVMTFGGCTWTEHANVIRMVVVYGTSDVNIAEGAVVDQLSFTRAGDGNITVNGTLGRLYLANDVNDKVPEDTKKIQVSVSGTSTTKIPLFIYRHDSIVTTKIPLDLSIYDTAPRCVVNFEPGSGGSTVSAFVEAKINTNGQEVSFKETGN